MFLYISLSKNREFFANLSKIPKSFGFSFPGFIWQSSFSIKNFTTGYFFWKFSMDFRERSWVKIPKKKFSAMFASKIFLDSFKQTRKILENSCLVNHFFKLLKYFNLIFVFSFAYDRLSKWSFLTNPFLHFRRSWVFLSNLERQKKLVTMSCAIAEHLLIGKISPRFSVSEMILDKNPEFATRQIFGVFSKNSSLNSGE